MTSRQAVEDFYNRIWNCLDRTAIAELLHPEVTFRGSLGEAMTGHAAFAAYLDRVTGALADYRCTILDLVSEGDRAFARMRFEGIHSALFMGFAPTGKPVEWSAAALFTLKAGKIADLWVLGDVDGLKSRLARNA